MIDIYCIEQFKILIGNKQDFYIYGEEPLLRSLPNTQLLDKLPIEDIMDFSKERCISFMEANICKDRPVIIKLDLLESIENLMRREPTRRYVNIYKFISLLRNHIKSSVLIYYNRDQINCECNNINVFRDYITSSISFKIVSK